MGNGLDGLQLGSLRVLNVGAGDLRFSFNSDDPVDVERARRTIEDMLQRGYTLLADIPRRGRKKGELVRVKAFDPRTDEYVIATEALYAGDDDSGSTQKTKSQKSSQRATSRSRSRKGATTRVKASDTRVVAIGRSAGG